MKSVELIPIWESTPIVIQSNILLQMKDLAGKEVEYGGRLFLTNCDMEQVIGQSRSVDYTTTNSRISYHTHPKITLGDAKPPSPFDIVVLCVMNSFYSKYSHVHLVVTNLGIYEYFMQERPCMKDNDISKFVKKYLKILSRYYMGVWWFDSDIKLERYFLFLNVILNVKLKFTYWEKIGESYCIYLPEWKKEAIDGCLTLEECRVIYKQVSLSLGM
jgi:hypothetical protein